ncbi:MAG: transcription repressor NadR [Eubacterium sp.]|nr:transcription repressor NadR [Eubacterium sp.]
MSGEKRRENLLKILQESDEPVSGTKLAENFRVSRQVIVQDIALLRAKNHDIISTHRGYVLQEKGSIQRVFKVKHSAEKLLDELNLIVDLGGQVEDVFVYHKLYGVIRVEMNVKSRKDAKKYVDGIYGGVSVPLEQITSEYHYHTVTADSTETLDEIQEELQKQGYLVALRDYEPVDFWSGV